MSFVDESECYILCTVEPLPAAAASTDVVPMDTSQPQQQRVLTMIRSEIHLTGRGMMCTRKVNLHFKAPDDCNVVTSKFRLPLTSDLPIAIQGAHARVGETELGFDLKAIEAARKEYQAAVSAGKKAGLVSISKENADVFELELGNMPASADIVVSLTMVGALDNDAKSNVRFFVQKVFGPRYRDTDQTGGSLVGTKGMRIAGTYVSDEKHRILWLSNAVDGGGNGNSIFKRFDVSHDKTSCEFEIETTSGDDVEFSVVFENPRELEARAWAAKQTDGTYALMASIGGPSTSELLPEETTRPFALLLDTSGSMEHRMDALKLSAKNILKQLSAETPLVVANFDDTPHVFGGTTRGTPGNAFSTSRAGIGGWIDSLCHSGTTETGNAVEHLAKLPGAKDGLNIMLLTDAETTDTDIARLCDAHFNADRVTKKASLAHVRLFVLGIGNGIKRQACRQLAKAFGGAVRFTRTPGITGEVSAAREDAQIVHQSTLLLQSVFQTRYHIGVDRILDSAGKQIVPRHASYDSSDWSVWYPGSGPILLGVLSLPTVPQKLVLKQVDRTKNNIVAMPVSVSVVPDHERQACCSLAATLVMAECHATLNKSDALKVCLEAKIVWKDVTALVAVEGTSSGLPDNSNNISVQAEGTGRVKKSRAASPPPTQTWSSGATRSSGWSNPDPRWDAGGAADSDRFDHEEALVRNDRPALAYALDHKLEGEKWDDESTPSARNVGYVCIESAHTVPLATATVVLTAGDLYAKCVTAATPFIDPATGQAYDQEHIKKTFRINFNVVVGNASKDRLAVITRVDVVRPFAVVTIEIPACLKGKFLPEITIKKAYKTERSEGIRLIPHHDKTPSGNKDFEANFGKNPIQCLRLAAGTVMKIDHEGSFKKVFVFHHDATTYGRASEGAPVFNDDFEIIGFECSPECDVPAERACGHNFAINSRDFLNACAQFLSF